MPYSRLSWRASPLPGNQMCSKWCWLSWKANLETWGKPEVRRSRKPLLPPVANRSRSFRRELGPQAESGSKAGSAWWSMVWQQEALPEESRAHSRDGVTLRDIYRSRERGGSSLPSSLPSSLLCPSCGISVSGNYGQGPWVCHRAWHPAIGSKQKCQWWIWEGISPGLTQQILWLKSWVYSKLTSKWVPSK